MFAFTTTSKLLPRLPSISRQITRHVPPHPSITLSRPFSATPIPSMPSSTPSPSPPIQSLITHFKSEPQETIYSSTSLTLAKALSNSLPGPFESSTLFPPNTNNDEGTVGTLGSQEEEMGLELRGGIGDGAAGGPLYLPPLWELIYADSTLYTPTSKLNYDGAANRILSEEGGDGDMGMERMWVGGEYTYNYGSRASSMKGGSVGGIIIGKPLKMTSTIESVEFKIGKGDGREGVYVTRKRRITQPTANSGGSGDGGEGEGIEFIERRVHLYRFASSKSSSPPKPSRSLSPKPQPTPQPDFQTLLTINPLHLFRFSALTFNAHRIHWDEVYSKEEEGRPGCLVHGPLTNLLLIESLRSHLNSTTKTSHRLTSWSYRATSPLVVGRKVAFNGRWIDDPNQTTQNGMQRSVELWAVDEENGRTVMKGVARVERVD